MTGGIENIIVATDLSETSNAAVARAGRMARHIGARITLVHVFNPLPLAPAAAYPGAFWSAPPGTASLRREIAQHLKRIRDDELGEVEHVERVTLEHTSAALAITDHAEKSGTDLIVVGTHGRTGASRLLIGSVAEAVIRHAPCSVLSVRPNGEEVPKHLLVATDFSPASMPAIHDAATLARQTDATVTLLHAYEPPSLLWREPRRLDQVDRELRAEMVERYAKFFGKPFEVVLKHSDNTALAIAGYASRHAVDLIFVATHGRTGLKRLLIGSVAEATTRHAPCSVWTAR
jgi:nucleotide-binding universal stress UspA family protein